MPPKKNIEPEVQPVVFELGEDTLQVLRDLTQAIVSQKAPVINLKSVDSTVLEALVKGLNQAPSRLEVLREATPVQSSTMASKQPTQPMPKEVNPEPVHVQKSPLTQIREMINLKVGEGKQPAIVALLKDHGAKNASTLDEEHFASFYTSLTKL